MRFEQTISFKQEDSRRTKLIGLGPEALADALCDLAERFDAVDDLIERLIASPEENVKRFKRKLAGLKRSRRFIEWRGSFDFARELEAMLQYLKAGVTEPLTGVELVAAFYETDENTLGRCDDSSGCVSDVYRFDAKKLFVDYAARCDDKEKIAEIVLKINRKDDYGIRDSLVRCAGEYLPEPVIRSMITTLQERADKEKDEYDKRHHQLLIESLARQIKDARLFEQTRVASREKLSTAAIVDIAEVYLESGDVETAHSWLGKIPDGDTFKAWERDKLLKEIYKKQGDNEKLAELLYRQFRSCRSVDALQEFLDVKGKDKQEEVIAAEVETILESDPFWEPDVEFLVSIGKSDKAEEYLIARADRINGDSYVRLLPLAKALEAENRNLAASLLYRSLLVSILERSYTKAYSHGARYLKKLDSLAVKITDWKNFENHEAFKSRILQAHGRKKSFWSKYEVK